MIPRIKICGIKHPEHIRTAVQAGADAIGLNFIPPSSRYVGGIQEAKQLIKDSAVPDVQWAGVFVNPDYDELKILLAALDLQIIQLHGNECPDFVRKVKARVPHAQVWKAFRIDTAKDLEAIADYVCDGVVVDAKVAGTFGGTGHTFDWHVLEKWPRCAPLILSGGLTPANVATAIQITAPDWVDVASGVESLPGEKCHEKIKAFIHEVKSAAGPASTAFQNP